MARDKRIHALEELKKALCISDISILEENKQLQERLIMLRPIISNNLKSELLGNINLPEGVRRRLLVNNRVFPQPAEKETDVFDSLNYDEYDEDINLMEYKIARHFLNPKLFSWKDLVKSSPPDSPGIYGWYFKNKEIPDVIPTQKCAYKRCWFRKWKLLYIGKAESSLRVRIIEEHFKGEPVRGIGYSTLRLSLGCLLANRLTIFLSKNPPHLKPEYSFGDYGEVFLSNWMTENARVAFQITHDPEQFERLAISMFDLPLNIEYNRRHPFCEYLRKLRKAFIQHALPANFNQTDELAQREAILAVMKGIKQINRK